MRTQSVRAKFQNLELADSVKIISSARRGVKPSVFFAFADTVKMPEKDLAGMLHIHPRTIHNYKTKRKNLEPVESEHLLKLIGLFAKGEELFGSIDEFGSWLNKPLWGVGSKPFDWLITPGGVDFISDELNRLAYGYAL